jgi:triacylglycerol esterase/lipase EstA (alpha/beta hydrolase family)
MSPLVRRVLFLLCLVVAALVAPAAIAQPSIPDPPADVEESVPEDVEENAPDGDSDGEAAPSLPDAGEPDLPEAPRLPEAVDEPDSEDRSTSADQNPPSGANDPCDTEDKRTPVVLVHGTFETARSSWSALTPVLEAAGYCVFTIDYGKNGRGFQGTQEIEDSAAELKSFIEGPDGPEDPNKPEEGKRPGGVLEESDTGQVSIVGHSQGGLMPRYYVKELGGKDVVDDMIGLNSSNHGTDVAGARLAEDFGECPACRQQTPYQFSGDGNDFTEDLNRGDETPGEVSYTQIASRFDEIVLPYFSTFLADKRSEDGNEPPANGNLTAELDGDRTTNVCLQDMFPNNTTEHQATQFDPQTFSVVLDALGQDGPADKVPAAQQDQVCAVLGQERLGGGDRGADENGGRDGNGRDDGNGSGNDGQGPAGPAPFQPVFSAEAFALAQCMSLDLGRNFRGIANLGSFGRCMSATVDVLTSGTTPAAGCRKQRLSTVRGKKRRSDFRACVLAASRAVVARRLAGF